MARFYKLLVMVCFLIIIDQLTKGWAQSALQFKPSISVLDGFFQLTYVENRGAAWGALADAPKWIQDLVLRLLTSAFTCWVIYMLIKTIKGPFHMSLAYALIVAGAIGNLIDRFFLGYVIDFLDFYHGYYHFPAFNVADSCISIAAGLLIFDMIINANKKDPDQLQKSES
jgi:signal peptidase II